MGDILVNKLKNRLNGVFTFLVTPFKPDNVMELDLEGLKRNVRYLRGSGIHALVPCGETGEIYSLTSEEIKSLIKVVANEKDDALLVPGVPPGFKNAVEIARYAEDVGADAILVFPPEKTVSEEMLYRYHKVIADAVNIGVMPYVTGSLATALTKNPSFIQKFLEIENVVAFKYESSDLWTLGELMHFSKDKVSWICGPNFSSRVTECYFRLGVQGFTDGISNFIPQLPVALYKSAVEGNWEEFKRTEERLAEITELRRKAGWTAFVKAALDMMGLAGGPVRPPLQPMSEEYKRPLEDMLRELKVLR
jgi:4-hydroxy-tetrahydrodipicolinate synthase